MLVRSPVVSAVLRLLVLGRPHRALLALSFLCMSVVAVTTGAYAFLMGPALRFLLTGGTAGFEPAARFVPGLEGWPHERLLLALPVAVVVIGAVKGAGYLGQFYLVGLFGQHVVVDLRRALFTRLLALSPKERSTRLSGDLLSRFTSDVAAVEAAATWTVASWLRDSLQVLVLAGVAVTLSWKLALLALLAVPVAVLPAARLTRALMQRTREGQGALGSLAGQVQEGLGALRTLQAFNAEALEERRFDGHARAVAVALTRAAWARAAVPGVMEVLASCAIAGTLAWATATHAVTPEALVSFLGALVLISQPAKDLGRVSQFAIAAAAALERIEAVLSLRPAITEPPNARELPPLAQRISVEGVHFAWSDHPALDGLSLTLEAGQVTALVGESGSGKSTLTSLLLRFEPPSAGRICFDGVDVASCTVASVRRQFALVTQEPLLFAGTVKENLHLARPAATQAELDAAAQTAHALDFIRALPQGWDTRIGERGVTLSGGQRQRLCLARAVLAQAPVLVLDEATSNLDPTSEREVQAALEHVLQGRTALVVAHRLSTIARADTIIVLERGRVLERGTHEALLAKGGRYAELWRRQSV